MAGLLDKIKGMLGGKGSSADGAAGASKMDTIKEKAGEVKDKVDDLVGKAGEKVPDKVKDVYGKVSEKVESIIPGDRGNKAEDGDIAADATPEAPPTPDA